MPPADLPADLKLALDKVTGKRAKAFVAYLVEHGSATTEELAELGYSHAPRAARDAIEQGIPVVKERVKNRAGRSITQYKLGRPEDLRTGLVGRKAFSAAFKKRLVQRYGTKCMNCGLEFEPRYLQPDHRIPVEVGGDEDDRQRDPDDYMLLDGSCNRAKSKSCEDCPNFVERDEGVCGNCYWAGPDRAYSHVATRQERRADITWSTDEVADFDALAAEARGQGIGTPALIKRKLRNASRRPNPED